MHYGLSHGRTAMIRGLAPFFPRKGTAAVLGLGYDDPLWDAVRSSAILHSAVLAVDCRSARPDPDVCYCHATYPPVEEPFSLSVSFLPVCLTHRFPFHFSSYGPRSHLHCLSGSSYSGKLGTVTLDERGSHIWKDVSELALRGALVSSFWYCLALFISYKKA